MTDKQQRIANFAQLLAEETEQGKEARKEAHKAKSRERVSRWVEALSPKSKEELKSNNRKFGDQSVSRNNVPHCSS